MPLFTAETAGQFSAKAHAALRQKRLALNDEKNELQVLRALLVKNGLPFPDKPTDKPAPEPDLFSTDLAHACEETLTLLRKTKDPQKRSQLARSLRDLRETWHLATGKPKPGQLKPDSLRTPRPSMPRVYPTAYNPIQLPTDTTGSTG